MPIARQWKVAHDCHILLWQITETPSFFEDKIIANEAEWQEYQTITHQQKQLEWLAGRYAVQVLVKKLGYLYVGIIKDEYGKPHLKNRVAELSLTHTKHYIGVVLHPTQAVGIDMEQIAPKLLRVAPKFLAATENAHAQQNLEKLCTYWCAKEAIYKMHGTRQLSFKDNILIQPFDYHTVNWQGNIIQIDNQPTTHHLHRFWIEDFCGIVAIN